MTQEEIIKFNSVKEFINWLIDNEGKILADMYGRQWKYERYGFKFKDIGTDDAFNDGLQCVHLFGTPIVVLSAYNGFGLGEVALCVGFERWEAILPNTCYMKCRLI